MERGASAEREGDEATTVLALEIDEASAKVRSGPPDDDDTADAELDVWAGEIPITQVYGTPIPSPGLRPDVDERKRPSGSG